MKEELLITTRMTRRMFHKLVNRLEKDREKETETMELFKDKEAEDEKHIYCKAMNRVRDLDLILEALFEED